MWAVSYLPPPTPPCHPLIPKLTTKPPLGLSISARSQPPGQDLRGFGQSILTKLISNPKPTNPALSKQEKGKQVISGSDVLFALQRAAAKKHNKVSSGKKKNKGQVSSSPHVDRHREEEGVDEYGKVRPLCVKSEWNSRLDELEKRLHELSSKAI